MAEDSIDLSFLESWFELGGLLSRVLLQALNSCYFTDGFLAVASLRFERSSSDLGLFEILGVILPLTVPGACLNYFPVY